MIELCRINGTSLWICTCVCLCECERRVYVKCVACHFGYVYDTAEGKIVKIVDYPQPYGIIKH